jgi:cbb3-type cytochrome oxidase subunit 3
MKKKINKIVFPLVSLLIFLSLFFIMNKVFATTTNPLAPASTHYGLDTTIAEGGLAAPFRAAEVAQLGAGQFLSTKVGQIVGAILSFIGVILLILVIYAGILWMTAAGNEKKTEQAKDILVSAIIGLIIVLSAYAITAFIGRQLTDTGALPSGTEVIAPTACTPPCTGTAINCCAGQCQVSACQ